jgi:hypothetical protein
VCADPCVWFRAHSVSTAGITWFIHLVALFACICCAVGYNENYRIWDVDACMDNPYFSGDLSAPNPYGNGCHIALLATSLAWAATAADMAALLLILYEVCRD